MSLKAALLVSVTITCGLIVTVMISGEGGAMSKVVWREHGIRLLQSVEDEVGQEDVGEDNEEYVVPLATEYYDLEEKDNTDKATIKPTTTIHTGEVEAYGKRNEPQMHGIQEESATAIVIDCIKERESKISVSRKVSDGKADTNGQDTHLPSPTKAQDRPNERKKKTTVKDKQQQATSTYTHSQTNRHEMTAHSTAHGHNYSSSQCTEPPCLQYLSMPEKKEFNKCQNKINSTQKALKCQCRFRDGVGKKRVALNSLPGSGNTWLRGLLEKITGFCTG